ncbi:MAG: S-layer y protein [Paenibacillus sp.]|jgi:hypothetical protein|nr:S-layer y protein [Paenibacillus sp.]
MFAKKTKKNQIIVGESKERNVLKSTVAAKISGLTIILMLLSVLMPILAFAQTGFKNVVYDGQTVSGTVYSDTYLPQGVAVSVYTTDGFVVTTTTAAYSVYNAVYEYHFSKTITSAIYDAFDLKESITNSVYQAVYDLSPPSWPDNAAITVTDVTYNSVSFTWPTAVDNKTGIEYLIYKNGVLIGSQYNVRGGTALSLSPSTSYTFRVEAADYFGHKTTNGPSVTVTTYSAPCTSCNSSGGGGGGGFQPSNTIDLTVGNEVAKEALEKAFAGNDNVTITIKGDSASLSAAGLVEAAKKAGASVTIVSENGTYVLPLSVLKLDDLAKSLGIAVADLNIKVSITKVSGATATAVADGVKAIGATSLTDAIDFKVTAEGKDGKSVEINSFGNTYVSRSVTISKAVDMKKVTGVLYNELTKKLSFVPATFETKDGKTVATLKRNGNSIYTVVEMNKSFTDIASHWSKDDVSLLANKLVIDGATDTTFAPDRNITRAEFAALVVRSLGLNTDATSTTFTDVKSSDWYAGAVAAAAGAKIINGYEDGTFNANAQITREELASMVVRALTFAGVKSDLSATQQAALLGKFTDASQIVWAKGEIAAAINAGVINGLTDTTIGSSKQATRAEAAAMLKRFLTKAGFIN